MLINFGIIIKIIKKSCPLNKPQAPLRHMKTLYESYKGHEPSYGINKYKGRPINVEHFG